MDTTCIYVLFVKNERGAFEKAGHFVLQADATNAAQELAYACYHRRIESYALDSRVDFFAPDGSTFARIAPLAVDDYSRIDELKARLAGV